MPLIKVKLTHSAFSEDEKQKIARVLTEAACKAESVPHDAELRRTALVFLEEVEGGAFYSNGAPADEFVAGVFIDWQVSTGVLDGARKAGFGHDVQKGVEQVYQGDRLLAISCVIDEVAEGQWIRNGSIMRLPEVAANAGFEHLQTLVS